MIPNQSCLSAESIVGVSAWAEEIRRFVVRAASASGPVLVAGPNGTGKELIARVIHALSPRAERRFVPVDCAAIKSAVFAERMFGYSDGGPAGDMNAALGCFRAAEGGTLFLDGIAALDVRSQNELLRVLQEQAISPVGSRQPVPADVRVIVSTARDLEAEVTAGRFSRDLYAFFQAEIAHTTVLADRPEDIAELAEHFLRTFASENGLSAKRLSSPAMQEIIHHDWPGNVDALESALEHAFVCAKTDVIGPEDLCPAVAECEPDAPVRLQEARVPESGLRSVRVHDADAWPSLDEVEREHLRRTLEHTNYDYRAAAGLLDIPWHDFQRRLLRYGLNRAQNRPGYPWYGEVSQRRAA